MSSPSFEPPIRSGTSHSSRLVSTDPTSDDCEPPIPSSSAVHPPHINDGQVPSPRVRRAGAAIVPSYSLGPSQYTGGFLTVLENPGDSPAPRLRPALWGPPSWVDGAFEGRRQTRSRSPTDYREDSSDEEEDLSFGGRTLPPLPVLDDPWHLGARTTSNISSTLSHDQSPGSEDPSVANSMLTGAFPISDPEGEYRRVTCSSTTQMLTISLTDRFLTSRKRGTRFNYVHMIIY